MLCWAIHLYIRLVFATNRWTVEGGEMPRRLRDEGGRFILAFWHGRLLMIPMAWQRLAPMHMLISAHRDGRIIADAVTYFGVEFDRRLDRRGGSGGIADDAAASSKTATASVSRPTARADRRCVASNGIVNVARLARVPIVPIVFATSRRRILRQLGPLSPCPAVRPRRLFVGRADRYRGRA